MLMMNIRKSQMMETNRERKEKTNINNEHSNKAAENIRTIREMVWGEGSICKFINSYSFSLNIEDGGFVAS